MENERTVIIDAGHGGQEPGATYEGRQEKNDTLRFALALGKALEERGIGVLYTRTTDVYQSPNEKAEIGNRSGSDLFLSIHRNAYPEPGGGSGALTLVYELGGESQIFAQEIQKAMVSAGFADLGITERPGLAVLRRTQIPAVLAEVGFIDREEDNALFDEKLEEIAASMAQGIEKAFQLIDFPVTYQVQTGAYKNRGLALALEEQLKNQGFPAFTVFEDGWYKVRVGAFLNMDLAVHMEQVLRDYGYPTVLIRRDLVSQ